VDADDAADRAGDERDSVRLEAAGIAGAGVTPGDLAHAVSPLEVRLVFTAQFRNS
jgi:hypothetical protein